jgi:hypothetical protein
MPLSRIMQTDTLAPVSRPLGDAVVSTAYWQSCSASGHRLWKWIAWAFAAYWIFFVAGAFLKHKQLNEVGAVIVLATLGWASLERLWIRIDSVALACLALAFLPVIQAVCSNVPKSPDSIIKHVSLCLVMALSRVLRLPVISQSKVRRLLAFQVLVILFISLTLCRGATWDGERYSGMFANPNNLALIPLLLLLLVDQLRDSWLIQASAHAVVILVLAFTTTSGAVVAYALGCIIYLISKLSRRTQAIAWSLCLAGSLVGGVAFFTIDESALPDMRLTKQLFLMRSKMGKVLQGGDIQYYQFEKVEGSGTGSALWRIQHWRDTLIAYSDGTVAEQVFGFGPGSSVSVTKILPHNEYLRMLFEEGLVGLALFLFAWYGIIRAAPSGIRYVAITVAIYSFSENNLDNFPFMALLVLCLSANNTDAWIVAPIHKVRDRFLARRTSSSSSLQINQGGLIAARFEVERELTRPQVA